MLIEKMFIIKVKVFCCRKSDLCDKIKREIFQCGALTLLLFCFTTCILKV